MTQPLSQAEYENFMKASVDSEAARAADVAGAPLVCIGLVLRDSAKQFAWYNRAHPRFASAVRASHSNIVAVVGVTEERNLYTNVHSGATEDDEKAFRRCIDEFQFTKNLPKKSTLCIARLSRQHAARQVVAGLVKNEKVLRGLEQVPAYVGFFFCRIDDDGYDFSWEEPDFPAQMMN